jgi:hypothetical protein
MMRTRCYAWLARALNIQEAEAHIGMMVDVALLGRVRDLCLVADPVAIRNSGVKRRDRAATRQRMGRRG